MPVSYTLLGSGTLLAMLGIVIAIDLFRKNVSHH